MTYRRVDWAADRHRWTLPWPWGWWWRCTENGVWGCVLAGLAALCSMPTPAIAKTWAGQVIHVSDGDTLWVQPDLGGEARKLRLAALDAPERCQLWGPQAWEALRNRLQGRHVQVLSARLDTYGRLLAQVWHEGQDVGAWMVSQGHAWSPTYRGLPGPYDALQRQAQWSRRGLFAHPLGLMAPREFRRWHGSC